MTTCACGAITWHGGVLSVYQDGVQHFGPDLICVQTDDLLIDGGVWLDPVVDMTPAEQAEADDIVAALHEERIANGECDD